jgi:hypothetical protein
MLVTAVFSDVAELTLTLSCPEVPLHAATLARAASGVSLNQYRDFAMALMFSIPERERVGDVPWGQSFTRNWRSRSGAKPLNLRLLT